MIEKRKSAIDELCELLDEAGLEVTFDSYRDNTKGCGVWCRGWNREATIFCGNHMEAIRRGDYVMPGGDIQKHMRATYQKLKEAEQTVADLMIFVRGVADKTYQGGGEVVEAERLIARAKETP